MDDLFEVQYESDFLKRTIPGGITKSSDVALIELIANAHDAGATQVQIIIPHDLDGTIIVEDNGVGMSLDDFTSRWMTLSYNRLSHQGDKVTFPDNLKHVSRKAYGRNGVGRHALLCFNDDYIVETWNSGKVNKFLLSSREAGKPIAVTKHEHSDRSGHGTRLSAAVTRNLPSTDVIRQVLSHRFFSMSDFSISINGEEVKLSDHPGMIDNTDLTIDGVLYKLTLVDTKMPRKDSYFQGVGVWVNGRRVGEQDWKLGDCVFLDGRKSFSKQYAVIVETNGLTDFILPDWSGFKPKSKIVNKLAEKIKEYVLEKRRELRSSEMDQIKEDALYTVRQELEELPDLARADVVDFVDEMLRENPELDVKTLELAVKAAVNLERSHLGQNLLLKLATIDPEDVDALDEMLDDWSARDASKALFEIDSRLKVIEALSRLSEDKNTDELHTIHPLILRARWLFGHEYESSAYSSNVGLVKTIKSVFGEDIDPTAFENSKKRPDIVILKSRASVAGYALTDIDQEDQLYVSRVLLIEVKRGGFEVSRSEFQQAVGYAEDIINSGILKSKPYVTAFVLGEEISDKVSGKQEILDSDDNKLGKVIAKPYSSLIATAEARLFQLRNTLSERYDEMKTQDLKDQSLRVNGNLGLN